MTREVNFWNERSKIARALLKLMLQGFRQLRAQLPGPKHSAHAHLIQSLVTGDVISKCHAYRGFGAAPKVELGDGPGVAVAHEGRSAVLRHRYTPTLYNARSIDQCT